MDTSNTRTEVAQASQVSLGQEWSRLLRYWLRDRRVLIGMALAVVAGGAVLNWSWLVAIGAAPLLLAAAPCAAMCAIGLCSKGKGQGGAACGKNAKGDAANEGDASLPATPVAKRERIPESE